MGWTDDLQHRQQLAEGVQQEFLADFTDEEQRILKALSTDDDKQINVLSVQTNIPMGQLSSILFSLEMKGAVQMLAGGKYKIRR
jgi:DNA processing protein